LAEIFYDCIGLPLSAAEVGANHKREREWMLAYPERSRQPQPQGNVQELRGRIIDGREDATDPNQQRLPQPTQPGVREFPGSATASQGSESCGGDTEAWKYWSVEPPVGRVAYGVARRMDRLKMLSNGQVPQCISRILNVQRGR
jgi:DNA (cytosine-5)-methyltransferase 1